MRSLYNDKGINSSRGYNINNCFPKIYASKYIKKVLTYMKRKIDSNPTIVKNLDTSISTMDRSFNQKNQ